MRTAESPPTPGVRGRLLARLSLALLGTFAAAACGGGLGTSVGGVGNTPNAPPETTFKILGTVGTPFTATVSNARTSWLVRGVVPLNVIIVNNRLPVRIVATKLTAERHLLSLEVVNGFTVMNVSSTSEPFGTLSLQASGTLLVPAPTALPDVRIFVRGPLGEKFFGQLEDNEIAFVVATRAPALFLFDSPTGPVAGRFQQIENFGLFDVNLSFNGEVLVRASGGPVVEIKQP